VPADGSTRHEPGPVLEPIAVLIYTNVPEADCLTGITYGLSLADHPEVRDGRPELAITVRPADPIWALRTGRMADVLRGRCPFSHGLAIGGPSEPGLTMSSFVIAGPAFLHSDDVLPLDLAPAGSSGRDVVDLAGCYPIHPSERDRIVRDGFRSSAIELTARRAKHTEIGGLVPTSLSSVPCRWEPCWVLGAGLG